ncbi:MAG: NADH-quinone oxidoreductase subunit J [Bdellovibrionota bacterium]
MNLVFTEAPGLLVWLASFCAVLLSLVVLLSANPVVSAIALMGTLFSTAGLYFLIGNYFMGSIQILVYAGAIAVLFVFIVMLLDLRPSLLRFIPGRKIYVASTGFAGGVLALFLLRVIWQQTTYANSAAINPDFQMTAQQISEHFVSKYQFAFQAAGLLIFGAILGAIVLARSHLKGEKQ